MISPFNQAILYQVVYPGGNNSLKGKALCLKLIIAQFMKVKNWKHYCLSQRGKWIHKLQSIPSVEYYSAFKNDEYKHCRNMETGLLYNVKWKNQKAVISAQLHKKYICFWIQKQRKIKIHEDDENANTFFNIWCCAVIWLLYTKYIF